MVNRNKETGFMAYLSNLKVLRQFAASHPTIYRLLQDRLTIKRFTGLPLTLLLSACLTNLLLIMDFVEDVINSKELIEIDRRVADFLFSLRTDFMAVLFYWFTFLCSVTVVTIISILCIGILLIKKKYVHVKSIIVTLIGSTITIYFGKKMFEIDRPHHYAYYFENSYSFPSGHTTIAVAFYGLLFYFMIRSSRSFKSRVLLSILSIGFVCSIGFSRLYLCVHFLSDVIAGLLIGSLWMFVAIGLYEWMRYKNITAERLPTSQ